MLAVGPLGIGPFELILILAVVVIIFGVGRLPEVGGAIGKGIREFRRASREPDEHPEIAESQARTSVEPPAPSPPSAPSAPPASSAPPSPSTPPVSQATVDCPQCRTSNPAGAKFCSECGASLQARVN